MWYEVPEVVLGDILGAVAMRVVNRLLHQYLGVGPEAAMIMSRESQRIRGPRAGLRSDLSTEPDLEAWAAGWLRRRTENLWPAKTLCFVA